MRARVKTDSCFQDLLSWYVKIWEPTTAMRAKIYSKASYGNLWESVNLYSHKLEQHFTKLHKAH